MTLPSIETLLKQRNLTPDTVTEAEAKDIVFTAIETDLAGGVAYLKKFQKRNWNALQAQEECCLHCEIPAPDLATRGQAIRLASYTPLRAYVKEKLGLLVTLNAFSPTSDDGGPSAQLAVEPVTRTLFGGKHTAQGQLETSPSKTWQVMNWGATAKPPAALPDAEATEHLWHHAQTHLAEGLAHLRKSAATSARVDGSGALIPQLVALLGVAGMHAVMTEKLGRSFQFYNCHGSTSQPPVPQDKLLEGVSFTEQLRGQADETFLHC